MSKSQLLYSKYHSDRDNERLGMFVALNDAYSIDKILYPGCFVHVTPSFVFEHAVYVDTMKSAETFFADPKTNQMVNKRKNYPSDPTIRFHKIDYTKKLDEEEASFDLLLSQYAGFISQACKRYLKLGGILVTNNSHGDASMASIDDDFEFIGVYNRRSDEKYSISEKNLASFMIPKSATPPTIEALEKSQRGIGYTKAPSGYLFRRVK